MVGGALMLDLALVVVGIFAWGLFGGSAVRAAVDWRLSMNPFLSLGVSAASVGALVLLRRRRNCIGQEAAH